MLINKKTSGKTSAVIKVSLKKQEKVVIGEEVAKEEIAKGNGKKKSTWWKLIVPRLPRWATSQVPEAKTKSSWMRWPPTKM